MIQVVIIEGGDEFSIPKNRIFVEVELSMLFFYLSGNKIRGARSVTDFDR